MPLEPRLAKKRISATNKIVGVAVCVVQSCGGDDPNQLSSPLGTGPGVSDDVVASFMPSPQALVELDRDPFTM